MCINNVTKATTSSASATGDDQETDGDVQQHDGTNAKPNNVFHALQQSSGDDFLGDHDGSNGAMDTSDSSSSSTNHTHIVDNTPTRMVLDAVALANLEVLQNNFDRTEKGSLWAFVNRTKTLFGSRLLKDWVCRPLFRVSEIQSRAAAVEELMNTFSTESTSARTLLKTVPDLERLLARVHSNGLKKKGSGLQEHPDARAVMYEMPRYNDRKIRDFSDVLAGFEVVLKVMNGFQQGQERDNITSAVLQRILLSPIPANTNNTATANSKGVKGMFPKEEITKSLQYFRTIFDEKQAKKDGNIKPRPGIDAEYDQAKATLADLERSLEEYLRDMKKKIGVSDLKYWGTNKDRYQIEVPIASTGKVPKDWTSKSQKKTHRRYWTREIEQMLGQLVDAEERIATAQKDTLRRVFEKFDEQRNVWNDALRCTATLDALLSLADISSAPRYVWPVLVEDRSSDNDEGVDKDAMDVSSSSSSSSSLSSSRTSTATRGPLLDIQAGPIFPIPHYPHPTLTYLTLTLPHLTLPLT